MSEPRRFLEPDDIVVHTMKIEHGMFDFHGKNFSRNDAPRVTPSVRTALRDLRLDRLLVIYPGARRYTIADRVMALPLVSLFSGGNGAGL